MELRYNLLSGGMNKLTVRKSYKPPHIEKRTNSIPRRGISTCRLCKLNLLIYLLFKAIPFLLVETKKKFSRKSKMQSIFFHGIADGVARFRLVLVIQPIQLSDLMIHDFALAKHSTSFIEDVDVVWMLGVFRPQFLR